MLKAANTATYHTPYWALREYVGHPYRVCGFCFPFSSVSLFLVFSLFEPTAAAKSIRPRICSYLARAAEEAQKGSRRGPKRRQRAPKKGPQSVPRFSCCPGAAQDQPRSTQERPQCGPSAAQECPGATREGPGGAWQQPEAARNPQDWRRGGLDGATVWLGATGIAQT